jgi:hypothetical protein
MHGLGERVSKGFDKEVSKESATLVEKHNDDTLFGYLARGVREPVHFSLVEFPVRAEDSDKLILSHGRWEPTDNELLALILCLWLRWFGGLTLSVS